MIGLKSLNPGLKVIIVILVLCKLFRCHTYHAVYCPTVKFGWMQTRRQSGKANMEVSYRSWKN